MRRYCGRTDDPSQRSPAMGPVRGWVNRNGSAVCDGPRLAPAKGRILAARLLPGRQPRTHRPPRHIGRSDVAKQETSAWDNAMIAHLVDDLQKASPARLWVLVDPPLPHGGPVRRLSRAEKLVPQLVGQISESGLPLAVAGSPAVRTSLSAAATAFLDRRAPLPVLKVIPLDPGPATLARDSGGADSRIERIPRLP